MGDAKSSSCSIESAIATGPDLVIIAGWQYDALGETADQFEAVGIPVLVLDYNAQTLEAHLASTLALGLAMGRADRAEALATFYAEKTADTKARHAHRGGAGLSFRALSRRFARSAGAGGHSRAAPAPILAGAFAVHGRARDVAAGLLLAAR